MSEDFPVVWERAEDGDLEWRLSTWTPPRPVPMLEREILVRFAAAMGRCLDEAGSGFRQDRASFMNGYCYMATSPLSEDEIALRRARHVAHAEDLERQGIGLYEGEVRPRLEARLGAIRRARGAARSRAALVAVLDDAMEAAADAMGNYHWRMSSPTPFDWKAEYHDCTGRPEAEAGVLLQGLGHATSRLISRLRALARDARRDANLLAVVAKGDVDSLAQFPAFRDSFSRLVRDHGRRTGFGAGSSVTFATPTWSMRPGMVLELIASYARTDLDAVEAAEARAKNERIALARRVRAGLRGEPDQRARFEAAYARAVNAVRQGENSNHLIEQETVGSMRQATNDVGMQLVRAGLLDDADDAFHLTLQELRDETLDLRALVLDRRAELAQQATRVAPRTLGKAPTASPAPPPALVVPAPAEDDRRLVRGVGVASGSVRGRARVVASSAEPPDVEFGDVLVAADAGPAWTPVFPIVAAIVLDRGSLTDHAAVMARDLGIPAVMRTTDGTKRLPDGAEVAVDGDAGTVTY